jgi:2-phospho-L-lactate guanylyltransferase (CobY/MobA/RfbA family)
MRRSRSLQRSLYAGPWRRRIWHESVAPRWSSRPRRTVRIRQNPAATRGLAEVSERGASAALLLSSDLPLVDEAALRRLLAVTEAPGSLVVAAPAEGRQGTNALYLRPPGDFTLHFGEASLPKFAEEARVRGRQFIIHEDPSLALDLDEPSDLTAWRRLEPTG